MAPIQSYAFFDLETTGLSKELNELKITELSIVIVKRSMLPRVLHKLIICFNPNKTIDPQASEVSGLNNNLLEFETIFDIQVFNTIKNFLACQVKPLCLIAHNGFKFHFPILKNHLEMLQANLDADVMCADSLNAFYDILEGGFNFQGAMSNVVPKRMTELVRPIFFVNKPKPTDSYRLKDIYTRVTGLPATNPQKGENDCLMMAQIAMAKAEEFVEWIDHNHGRFSEVLKV